MYIHCIIIMHLKTTDEKALKTPFPSFTEKYQNEFRLLFWRVPRKATCILTKFEISTKRYSSVNSNQRIVR